MRGGLEEIQQRPAQQQPSGQPLRLGGQPPTWTACGEPKPSCGSHGEGLRPSKQNQESTEAMGGGRSSPGSGTRPLRVLERSLDAAEPACPLQGHSEAPAFGRPQEALPENNAPSPRPPGAGPQRAALHSRCSSSWLSLSLPHSGLKAQVRKQRRCCLDRSPHSRVDSGAGL